MEHLVKSRETIPAIYCNKLQNVITLLDMKLLHQGAQKYGCF